ncbi:right-handed parallel beta-helix repeat-containing protein [Methanobrevibacter sp.]|uniref:right-handed parallel beta-helix repeat-containing protein n=1 Tax=Methanobrevibacter sp. TaxID=66852 RepID=UPI00388EF14F
MDKKALNLFFIFIVGLFLVSAVYASDNSQVNDTIASSDIQITSDLSNNDIQNLFDDANEDTTFEFTDKEYNNISLVVDKKLNIVSNSNSVVNVLDGVSDTAKSLGIDKTFGFYFTSNSAGSVLSGITIKANSCDSAIIVDGASNVNIKNDYITGGDNSVLIKNSDKITLSSNKITKAKSNGILIQNAKSCVISKNNIWNNKRSGIETSNIYNCKILNNTIHHNGFNGISMYNISSGNTIKYNKIHNNTNGIFVNSESSNDLIVANTLSHNRRDPYCELGPDESGNGLLLGDHFRTKKDSSKLLVKNNALIHNEQFQAKNNPANEKFELDQNWFDSTDNENTFVCPMLLAKILKLDAITIKNGIGLQVKDPQGNVVNEMGTFDVDVEVNGNKYTTTVENGIAKIQSPDLEPNTEYEVDVTIGEKTAKKVVKYRATAGSEDYQDPYDSKSNNDDNKGSEDDSNNGNAGSGNGNGNGNGNGRGNSSSTDSHIANSGKTGKFGDNSSNIQSSDSSDSGMNAMSYGDSNAGSSSEGLAGEEGKAYEVVPTQKISKTIVDTSGIVVISIVSLLGCIVYGYRRNLKFED